jgi:hypothetical protein
MEGERCIVCCISKRPQQYRTFPLAYNPGPGICSLAMCTSPATLQPGSLQQPYYPQPCNLPPCNLQPCSPQLATAALQPPSLQPASGRVGGIGRRPENLKTPYSLRVIRSAKLPDEALAHQELKKQPRCSPKNQSQNKLSDLPSHFSSDVSQCWEKHRGWRL